MFSNQNIAQLTNQGMTTQSVQNIQFEGIAGGNYIPKPGLKAPATKFHSGKPPSSGNQRTNNSTR